MIVLFENIIVFGLRMRFMGNTYLKELFYEDLNSSIFRKFIYYQYTNQNKNRTQIFYKILTKILNF